MIRFKDERVERGFALIHPELRSILKEFDDWSTANKLPEPLVTELLRDPVAQKTIYVNHYIRLQAALVPGPRFQMIDPEGDGTWRHLTLSELNEAREIRNFTPSQLEHRAANRFTWHMVLCAADLRVRHYAPEAKSMANLWFKRRCPRPRFEFVSHDVTAPHFHVAVRDEQWRKNFGPKPTPSN